MIELRLLELSLLGSPLESIAIASNSSKDGVTNASLNINGLIFPSCNDKSLGCSSLIVSFL